MKTLDQVVALTIRRYRGGGKIEELADHLGIKPSMLYRLSNPLDDARINSKHLIPLMEKTRDFSILRHLAARLGWGLYKIPRVRTAKAQEIAAYQEAQAKAIQAVLGFFAGGRGQEETLAAIREEMSRAAGFLKAVEEHPRQGLFEEEP